MTTNKTPPFESIKPKEPEPDTLSKRVNLKVLFRVSDNPGLYYPKASPSKDGMVRMYRYGGGERCTVHKRKTHGPLSNIVVFQNDGGSFSLADVLDRLEVAYKGEVVDIDGFMEAVDVSPSSVNVICPDLDLDRFKPYHAKRIIGWYNELIQRSKIENSK